MYKNIKTNTKFVNVKSQKIQARVFFFYYSFLGFLFLKCFIYLFKGLEICCYNEQNIGAVKNETYEKHWIIYRLC